MESLQIAELENYFRQGCLDNYKVQIDDKKQTAIVIYPIVLPDRVAVITSIPNQKPTYHSRPIPKGDFEQIVSNVREVITNPGSSTQESLFKSDSKKIHDLLIAPTIDKIQKSNN